MIKFKKEFIFVRLFKHTAQDLEEQELIEKDDFLFQRELQRVLNRKIALSLLIFANYVPWEYYEQLLKAVISDNFNLTKSGARILFDTLKSVGEFSLNTADLMVEKLIEIYLKLHNEIFFSPHNSMPSITDMKANSKVEEFLEAVTNQFNKNTKLFSFKLKQNNKISAGNLFFPSILNGVFQRLTFVQMIPNQANLLEFPQNILPNNIDIMIPKEFLARRGAAGNRIQEVVDNNPQANIESDDDQPQQVDKEEINNDEINNNNSDDSEEEEEKEDQDKLKDQGGFKPPIAPPPARAQSEHDDNDMNQSNKIKIDDNKSAQNPNSSDNQSLKSNQIQPQIIPQNLINNPIQQNMNNQQQGDAASAELLLQQKQSSIQPIQQLPAVNNQQGLNAVIISDEQKQQQQSQMFKINDNALPNTSNLPKLKSREQKQKDSMLSLSASVIIQEPALPPPQKSLFGERPQIWSIPQSDLNGDYYKQDYFGKQWKPYALLDCRDYYLKFKNMEDQKKGQLKLNQQELENITNQNWDNIYDICFKAAYFHQIINSQETEDLKAYCELFIIDKHQAKMSKKKDVFSGCQNIAYITLFLLYFFKNESFYKLYIGCIVDSIPSLFMDQAYDFSFKALYSYMQEQYIVFNMLIIYDNPLYLSSFVEYRQNFVLKFMSSYTEVSYRNKFQLEKELSIISNFRFTGINPFQKRMQDEYFKLINCSEINELASHLLTVQTISNHTTIIELEQFLDSLKSDKDQAPSKKWQEDDAEQEVPYYQKLNQIKTMFSSVYPTPQFRQLPTIHNISQVNLYTALERKLKSDQQSIKEFKQKIVFTMLNQLLLTTLGRCPNFTIQFVPQVNFGMYLRRNLLWLVEHNKKMAKANKDQVKLYQDEAIAQIRKDFGPNIDKIYNQCNNVKDSNDCSELLALYFPVFFYEYYEQQQQQQQPQQ